MYSEDEPIADDDAIPSQDDDGDDDRQPAQADNDEGTTLKELARKVAFLMRIAAGQGHRLDD